MLSSRAYSAIFFKGCLSFRVSLGYQRPRFSEPEAKLPEQTLALSHTKVNATLLFYKAGEQFPIPYIARQSIV
jgi:hypothetical protein